MAVCPYCMATHSRPGASYCCSRHALMAANQRQRANARADRALARMKRHREQLALQASQWRGVSVGRKSVEELTAEIFGVSVIPPFRDPAA